MSRVNKIIFIDLPGKDRIVPVFEDDPDSNYFFHQGWSLQLARLINSKTDFYNIEIWRIDSRVNELRTRTVNGMTCKIFPRRDILGFSPYSRLFFMQLKWELKNNRVLIHFSGLHNLFFLIVGAFSKRVPLVAHQTGFCNHLWRFRKNRRMRTWLYSFFERKLFLKKLSLVYVVGEEEKKYLSMELAQEKLINDASIQTIDFDLFTRRDKKKSRERLDLPLEKKIILQPYRATIADGSGIAIDEWQKHLKAKGILFYMINIDKSNELYQKVVDSGIEFRGRYRWDEMPYWYSAADIVIYPSFDEELLAFGGVGYSVFESLACGTPVVSTTLKSFPNFKNEEANLKRICRIPEKVDDVAPMILDMLENPSSPAECRNLVYKYLNEDDIAANYLDHANRLLQKHYGVFI